jgi:outer membrane protein assembly factor BamA
LATDNGSRGAVLFGEFFLKQNTYHITTLYLKGNLNYDFYGIGTSAGNAGLKLPVKQSGQVFFAEILYRVWGDFFVGPRLLTGESTITLRPSSTGTLPPPPDTGIQTSLSGLGFRVNRDTRPNRFYPTAGTLFDFSSTFFAQGLGSKYSFQSYRFTFNYYRSLSPKQILAYNVYACATSGSPPFYGECIYGTNNELRGYVAFQYLDRYMLATQLEYRLTLSWRFGAVAFGGIGEVAPSVCQFRYRNILPAYGGGLRFKLSKKYVNLRADIAQGNEGHTFSMGIGEAF